MGFRDWRQVIQQAVTVLNTQRQVVPGINPGQVTWQNHLEVESQVNEAAFYPRPVFSPFRFALGQVVGIKLTSLKGFQSLQFRLPWGLVRFELTSPQGGQALQRLLNLRSKLIQQQAVSQWLQLGSNHGDP